jgi:DnaJ-class molecular chaperone
MASTCPGPPCGYCQQAPCVGANCPSNWYEDGLPSGVWESCWYCHGAGEFDEYDADPVNYAEGEEVTPCPECHGRGGYYA